MIHSFPRFLEHHLISGRYSHAKVSMWSISLLSRVSKQYTDQMQTLIRQIESGEPFFFEEVVEFYYSKTKDNHHYSFSYCNKKEKDVLIKDDPFIHVFHPSAGIIG